MTCYPNAKINIGLDVVSKRADGYHELRSIMYPILALHDELQIERSDIFAFSQLGRAVEGNAENNIVVRAFRLMQEIYGISNVKITLTKNIPLGAGLGGGSADGAFTLKALNELFCLQLQTSELEQLALRLGADAPFFIQNSPQAIAGIGEKLTPTQLKLDGYTIVLIKPKESVSTAQAYQHIKPQASATDYSVLSANNLRSWQSTIKNDFEQTVFPLLPRLQSIKQMLYRNGAVYASMSGSGSCMYGIFKQQIVRREDFTELLADDFYFTSAL